MPHHHVVIIGAGFAGLGAAIALRNAGERDIAILERGARVGGVWRDNTYPGCQCDVPSHLYSFSFAPKHDWSRSFGLQAEILDYLEDVADRYELRRLIAFDTPVSEALWDEPAGVWRIWTPRGEWTADILVAGLGGLSEPNELDLPGLANFEGAAFHSSKWRHDIDLAGKRVAAIGTGASAIQFVPAIQPVVDRLDVYQRTPPWVVPRMDGPIGKACQARYRRFPFLQRTARLWQYWIREATVVGFTRWPAFQAVPRFTALRHMKKQIADPALRERLTPRYEIGCKRILLSDEWYPAIQQPNVEVVSEPIAEVRPRSIVTSDGRERETDAIVFGTGFRVTTHPGFDRVYGREGVCLGERWKTEGMEAFRGTTVAGYPNLFIMTGPNTGLGHTSMVFMMESQFAYLADAVVKMRRQGIRTLEPKADVQSRYNTELQARLARSVWMRGGCSSWYIDHRGCNTTLWPGSTWAFRRRLRRFDLENYNTT